MKLHHRITAFLASSVLMVGLGGASLLWSFQEIEGADLYRSLSADVIEHGQHLVSMLTAAETGKRGYLLTGNDAFLDAYMAAPEQFAAGLKKLADETLIAAQKAHLDAIAPLADAKFKEMADMIALRRSGDVAGAISIVSISQEKSQEKNLMDAIRAEMTAFIDIEQTSLAERTATRQSTMRHLLSLIVATSLCALLSALAFAWLTWRYRRQQVQQLVQLETRHLHAIQQQTDLQLQASEEKLAVTVNSAVDAGALIKAVLDTVADGIITFRASDSSIEIVNPAAEHMFGYSSEQLLEQPLSMLMPEPEAGALGGFVNMADLTDVVGHEIEPGREGPGRTERGATREVAGRRRDGSVFAMEVTISELLLGGERHFTAILHDLGKRKRAAAALAEAGALQSAIFNSANFSSIATDAAGVIQIFNVGAERMLGYTANDVMNRLTPADISDPLELVARAAALSEEFGRAIAPGFEALAFKAARGIEDIYELTYLCKDGHRLPAIVSVTALRAAQRAIIGYLLIGTDNSARQQAEKARNHLFALSLDMLCMISFDGNFKSVNPAWTRTLGYTEAELLATPYIELIHPDDRLRSQAAAAEVCDGKLLMEFENRYLCKDGSIRWLQWSVAPVVADRMLYCVARDITVRKQDETSQLHINAIAFESQDSLMITDAAGVTLRVNHAFTAATGYAADEAVGRTPALLKSDRHDPPFYRAMWEALQSTGLWRGEVWNRSKSGAIYPVLLTISAVKDSDGSVTHYVGSQIDMTQRLAAEDMIRNMAFYDTLTGLPNRRMLMDQLQRALDANARNKRNGAVLFIDLDNFKDINDTLGHDIGDLLLQQTAQRLQLYLRGSDCVARLGGDEFVVMLSDLSEQALGAVIQTEAIGNKVLTALQQPYQLAQYAYRSTASIGAAMFSEIGQSAQEILKRADIAMYQAKKSGRNTFQFFNPRMQDAINTRTTLEIELRQAIENGQFRLYYQIQVDNALQTTGAEGLIRWMHPERGLVSPADFIELAEETGLILPIGLWVLDTACSQIKAWERNALTCKLVLSVNVSAKQFRQTDFAAQISALMQRHMINPELLKLEITESMLQGDIENTIAAMIALKKIGVQFSLDDFGTGYSSLQYLKRLPLDQIKIDQSFVRDLVTDNGDQVIVSTIIAMAQSMHLGVIAEGVETEEQFQRLLESGCTHYQGYLFGRPVPAMQFESLLQQRALVPILL
jgi:diguanylate cyclase (GGDEF)-like protein/PAS domain S-box-containing protein